MNAPLSRRAFITATGAGLLAPALGEESAKPTRIDCQSPRFCPEIVAIMERRRHDPRVFTRDGERVVQMGDWLRRIPPAYLDVEAKQVLKRGPKNLQRKPSEYVREVWFDGVSPLAEAIRFCHGLAGPGRLLFASDHPWVQPQAIMDALAGANLPPADLEAINAGNARRLFKL